MEVWDMWEVQRGGKRGGGVFGMEMEMEMEMGC